MGDMGHRKEGEYMSVPHTLAWGTWVIGRKENICPFHIP
jgi:hypothetical protein